MYGMPITGKKWAIFIYACGNNDLAPEMANIIADIAGLGEIENVHVALQIGRECYELVQILRQSPPCPKPDDEWQGVRQYAFQEGNWTVVDDLGKANMAHPETLRSFLLWGYQNFPAEKYMLVIGGHGYQFVGTVTDYSQSVPYIMGIPGLVEAINQASRLTGKQLDLALLDTCYFNFVEVLYEFGAKPVPATKHIITYIGGGPIQGLSCRGIIAQADKLAQLEDTKDFISAFTSKLGTNLVAFEINHERLMKVKCLFNDIARLYSEQNPGNVNFQQILNQGDSQTPWYNLLTELVVKLNALLICAGAQGSAKSLINIASQPTTDLEKLKNYSRLSFAKNNYWTYLLSDRTIEFDSLEQVTKVLAPLRLSPREVCCYISLMNPGFSPNQVRDAFIALAKYKMWTFD